MPIKALDSKIAVSVSLLDLTLNKMKAMTLSVGHTNIAKMKARTHLAHKAEHGVDMD